MNSKLLNDTTQDVNGAGKPGRPTGPRTEEGKAISSANSLKTGLYAKLSVLIPGEDPEEYNRHREGILKTYRLEGQMELAMAQMVCDTMWRIQRLPRLEAHYMAEGNDRMVEYVGKQDARLNRILVTQLRELNHLIDERLLDRSNDLDAAAVLRMKDVADKRETDLAALGFVFTLDEVDAAVRNEVRWSRAVRSLNTSSEIVRGPVLSHMIKR